MLNTVHVHDENYLQSVNYHNLIQVNSSFTYCFGFIIHDYFQFHKVDSFKFNLRLSQLYLC